MPVFKADLHIHTLLSPCGSLEMSPVNIVEMALKKKLDVIAITDHNSTKQAPLIVEMANEKGLCVFPGAEVNSSEEVHCLTLFETIDQLQEFQYFIDQHTLPIPNKPESFGEQVVVDRDEMIVEEVKYLLIAALDISLLEIEKKVHQLGGLVIPAHIDRPYYGIFSQLGFIPDGLSVDAVELSVNARPEDWRSNGKITENLPIIRNSDAHHPGQIGETYSLFEMENCSFKELKMALKNENGRRVLPVV